MHPHERPPEQSFSIWLTNKLRSEEWVNQFTKKNDSVIPSHGQISSVSARFNHLANDIIAIEHFFTASGEGWKYADFSAMVRVMLMAFELTVTTKEWRIKIGIALDAASVKKMLSVFSVSIITSDPDAFDPKTVKKISEFFQLPTFSFYSVPVPSVLTIFSQKKINDGISSFLFSRLSGKIQKIILRFLPRFSMFSFLSNMMQLESIRIFCYLILMSLPTFLLLGRLLYLVVGLVEMFNFVPAAPFVH
jgi:hypothetical protein